MTSHPPLLCVSILEHFRLSPSRLSPSWSRLRPSTAWQTWTASPTCCPSRQVSSLSLPASKQIAVNFHFLDFKVDAVSLNDLDFWDKGGERAEDRYVVASRPGHLEARWEQQHRSVTTSQSSHLTVSFLKIRLSGDLWPAFICLILRWSQMTSVQSKTEKWESGSVASSNSSHFDFSSNADEVFSQIGLPESVAAAEFITL